jgi:CBS domain-containing protein
MLKARDIMTTQVVSVDPDDSITKTLDLMFQHGLSSLPVVNGSGRLVGIISEFDLLELAWDGDCRSSEVYQYMTRQVHTVDEDEELSCVAERFRLFGISRLPVLHGERVVGIIDRHVLLACLANVRLRPRLAAAA